MVITCILKNGAKIAVADSGTGSGEQVRANKTFYDNAGATDGNTMNSLSSSFLDSPATTSAITYAVGGFSNNTNVSTYNRRISSDQYGQVSEIILMEVAQ